MFKLKSTGKYNKTRFFLKKISSINYQKILDDYGRKGVILLSQATPKDSGITADSWGYYTTITPEKTSITWTNSSIEGGLSVVMLIQYGHATKNGKFFKGFDFVTPAIMPVFEEIAEAIWREVTNA